MQYAVIFEQTATGWSAYVPDFPGLGVAGPTYEAVEQLIREGMVFTSKALLPMAIPFPNQPNVLRECRFPPEFN
jgi:predicted RNase H-like HicB family nuclease